MFRSLLTLSANWSRAVRRRVPSSLTCGLLLSLAWLACFAGQAKAGTVAYACGGENEPLCVDYRAASKVGHYGCPEGTFRDPIHGGECWKCPSDYHRTARQITDARACRRGVGNFAGAIFVETEPTCGDNQIKRNGDECWGCIRGYEQNRILILQPDGCVLREPGQQCDANLEPAQGMCMPTPALPSYSVIDGYGYFSIEGFNVFLNADLLDTHPQVALDTFAHIESDLQFIRSVLPVEIYERLRTVKVWVEHAWPASRNDSPRAGEYHENLQFLEEHSLPSKLHRSVQLYAVEYGAWSDQPAVLLHELSHAYHDQWIGFEEPSIIAAYDSAVRSGTYDSVERVGSASRLRAYAMTNYKEYFAELSEAWLWRNDFFPFVRSQLEAVDPQGAGVVERFWSRATPRP